MHLGIIGGVLLCVCVTMHVCILCMYDACMCVQFEYTQSTYLTTRPTWIGRLAGKLGKYVCERESERAREREREIDVREGEGGVCSASSSSSAPLLHAVGCQRALAPARIRSAAAAGLHWV